MTQIRLFPDRLGQSDVKSPRLITTLVVIAAVALLPRLVYLILDVLQIRPSASLFSQAILFLANFALLATIVAWIGRRYPGALASECLGRRAILPTVAVATMVTLVLSLASLLPAWLQYTTLESLPWPPPAETNRQILDLLEVFWGNYSGYYPLYSLAFSLLTVLLVGPVFEEAMHSLMLSSLLTRFKPDLSIVLAACLYFPPHLLLRHLDGNSVYLIVPLFVATGLARCWSGHWLAAVFVHAWANLLVLAGPLSLAVFVYQHYVPRV